MQGRGLAVTDKPTPGELAGTLFDALVSIDRAVDQFLNSDYPAERTVFDVSAITRKALMAAERWRQQVTPPPEPQS